MKAVVAGTSYPLTYSATTGRWSTAGTPISTPAGAGQRPVTLSWELQDGTWNGNTCTTRGNNRCTGTINSTLQRSYGAINTATGSGPITTLSVLTGGGASVSNHSYALGSTVSNVVVRIGIQDVLGAGCGQRPARTAARGGRLAEPVGRLRPERLHAEGGAAPGCAPIYGRNSGTNACATSASALWGSPQPWLCVAIQTGGAANQVPAGLNERILGTDKPNSCTSPNHWSQLPAGRPADRPGLRHAVRLVRRQRLHHRAGHRLRRLLHHRLDRAGRRLQQPLPGQRRRPCPRTPQPSSATSSSTSTQPATAAGRAAATSRRRFRAPCIMTQ